MNLTFLDSGSENAAFPLYVSLELVSFLFTVFIPLLQRKSKLRFMSTPVAWLGLSPFGN